MFRVQDARREAAGYALAGVILAACSAGSDGLTGRADAAEAGGSGGGAAAAESGADAASGGRSGNAMGGAAGSAERSSDARGASGVDAAEGGETPARREDNVPRYVDAGDALPAGNALPGPRDAGSDGARSADAGGVQLFNGIDLTGWEISTTWPPALSSRAALTPAEAQRVFKVDAGVLHVYADASNGSEQVRATLTTVASYTNYRLSLDYRWGTKKFAPYVALARDAGILFHVTGDRRKVWPDSTEFQIKENETGDIFALGSTCTSLARSGGDTFVDAADGGVSKLIDGTGGNAQHKRRGAFEVPEWNTVELTVTNDSAVFVVNGQIVNKVFNIQDRGGRRVTSGPIALQAEHAEVLYRNVRLEVLP